MITEVKNFIETFLQAELDAKNAHLGTDQEIRSNKVKAMYSFADQTLEDKLGLLIDRAPRNKKIRYAETRKLLKISHYTRGENYSYVQEKYPDLFLCYVSDLDANPQPDFIPLNLCYFVGKENGEYKIVMVYRLGEGFIRELGKDGYGWFLKAGRDDLLPEDEGEPLTYGVGKQAMAFEHFGFVHEIVRYQAPTYKSEGDASISEYEKEI